MAETMSIATRAQEGRRFGAKLALLAVALLAAVGLTALPSSAYAANTQEVDVVWYTDDPTASEFYLEDAGDLRGLSAIVNGEALDAGGASILPDSFEGKTIYLDANVSLGGREFAPIGTQEHPFAGTFDAANHSISGLVITSPSQNAGLFGYCSQTSKLCNVVLASGGGAGISIESDVDILMNIGSLVGYTDGSIENCQSQVPVTVASTGEALATVAVPSVVENIGGLVGFCCGDMTDCVYLAQVEASAATCAPETDSADNDNLIVAEAVGGVVGRFGEPGHHGTLLRCKNEGTVWTYTTGAGAKDRFGTTTYAKFAYVGGVAGYSNGSILECQNGTYNSLLRTSTGLVSTSATDNPDGELLKNRGASSVGGIVGGLVATSDDPNRYNDGDPDDPLTIADCSNQGRVIGLSSTGGMAGQIGAYTLITRCYNGTVSDPHDWTANQVAGKIMTTRWNSPGTGGILGSGRGGSISFCANYAEVRNLQTGYYTAGIAGWIYGSDDYPNLLPEVYSCLNTGGIYTVNEALNVSYREGGLMGSNEGYIHDCIMLEGCVPFHSDKCIGVEDWGMFNNLEVMTAEQLQSSASAAFLNGPLVNEQNWDVYWYCEEGGYPVLSSWRELDESQTVALSADVISAAEQLEPAPFVDKGGSIPTLRIELTDGTVLVQNADFYVVPQADALAISEGEPYRASIVGIGRYRGTVNDCASYGIGKSSLEAATLSVGEQRYALGKVIFPTEISAVVAGSSISSDNFDYVIYSKSVNQTMVQRNPNGCTVAFDSLGTIAFGSKDAERQPVLEVGVEAINASTEPWWMFSRSGELISDSTGAAYYTSGTGGTAGTKVGTIDGCVTLRPGTPAGYVVKATAKEGSEVLEGSVLGSYVISPISLYRGGVEMDKAEVQGQTWYWRADNQTFYNVDGEGQPVAGMPSVTFTGETIEPELFLRVDDYNLKKGVDYRVVCGDPDPSDLTIQNSSNRDVTSDTCGAAVTVRPVNSECFSNYIIGYFNINPAKLSDCEISLDTQDWAYRDGQPIEPEVHVTLNGVKLIEGTDYEVTYANNTQKGTASYTVQALANLQGDSTTSISGEFNIVDGQDLSELTMDAIDDQQFNYGYDVHPNLVLRDSQGTPVELREGLDYRATFSTKDVTKCVGTMYDGKAYSYQGTPCTVTLEGIGLYTGSISGEFDIVPYDATENATNQLRARTQKLKLDEWNNGTIPPYNVGLTCPIVNVLAYPIVDWAAYEAGDYETCYGNPITLGNANNNTYGGTVNNYPAAYYQNDVLVSFDGKPYTDASKTQQSPVQAQVGAMEADVHMRVGTSGNHNGAVGALRVTGLEVVGEEPDPPAVAYGDVNGDGYINTKDARLVLQASVGQQELSESQRLAADVNGDGYVNAKDARLILQKSIGAIEAFPVENQA